MEEHSDFSSNVPCMRDCTSDTHMPWGRKKISSQAIGLDVKTYIFPLKMETFSGKWSIKNYFWGALHMSSVCDITK